MSGQPVKPDTMRLEHELFLPANLKGSMMRSSKTPTEMLDRFRCCRREILNHSNLSHPQVVQFKEVKVCLPIVCTGASSFSLRKPFMHHSKLSQSPAAGSLINGIGQFEHAAYSTYATAGQHAQETELTKHLTQHVLQSCPHPDASYLILPSCTVHILAFWVL